MRKRSQGLTGLRGAYCLIISVPSDIRLKIGALGIKTLPKSTYIYVGSALNSLEARIKRYVKTNLGFSTKIHWHIDYLLRNSEARLREVWYKETDKREECLIAEAISTHGSPVKGFGCTDCHCVSHLFKVEETTFLKALGLRSWKEKLYDSASP